MRRWWGLGEGRQGSIGVKGVKLEGVEAEGIETSGSVEVIGVKVIESVGMGIEGV